MSANLRKISPSTGVPYSEALRSELARRLSAAAQRSSSSCLSCSAFNDCPVAFDGYLGVTTSYGTPQSNWWRLLCDLRVSFSSLDTISLVFHKFFCNAHTCFRSLDYLSTYPDPQLHNFPKFVWVVIPSIIVACAMRRKIVISRMIAPFAVG